MREGDIVYVDKNMELYHISARYGPYYIRCNHIIGDRFKTQQWKSVGALVYAKGQYLAQIVDNVHVHNNIWKILRCLLRRRA